MEHAWIQYGALGIVAFVMVSVVSLTSWFVKHITPKAIEAFNENVKLQKAMSETLLALNERLHEHDRRSEGLTDTLREDIRGLHSAIIVKFEEHGRKIDRLLERT